MAESECGKPYTASILRDTSFHHKVNAEPGSYTNHFSHFVVLGLLSCFPYSNCTCVSQRLSILVHHDCYN